MLKGEPKSTCGLQAKLEIRVERQVEHDSRPARRKALQPKAMLRASERHDGMPAIRRATNLAARQIGEIELVAFGRHAIGRPHRQYGRQHFGCPEDCLLVECLLRISWKTKAPTSVASGSLLRWIVGGETTAYNPLGNRDPGAATPRPRRQLLPSSGRCMLPQISSQYPASHHFPAGFHTRRNAAEDCGSFRLRAFRVRAPRALNRWNNHLLRLLGIPRILTSAAFIALANRPAADHDSRGPLATWPASDDFRTCVAHDRVQLSGQAQAQRVRFRANLPCQRRHREVACR
ncbi:hypothetical protein ABH975_006832 [Bradyrhizobium ottawaense]